MNVSKIMFLFFLFLSTIALVNSSHAELFISEVMYDPVDCLDSQCEWVELHNQGNQTISTDSCILDGKLIGQRNISANSFLLVARNSSAVNEHFSIANRSEIVEAAISLRNNGEELILEGARHCQDSFDYGELSSQERGSNNYSLERNRQGEWLESRVTGGSPGSENTVYNFSRDSPGIVISEFLVNPLGNDSAEKPFGEWVELHNQGPFFVDLQHFFLSTSNRSNELYISETNVLREVQDQPETVIAPGEYLTVYRNRDSDFSLTNSQGILKLWNDETLLDSVSYSSSQEGNSWSLVNGSWFLGIPSPERENVVREGCDWSLQITSDNHFTDDDFSFTISILRVLGRSSRVTVTGRIEDHFGNVVKQYRPWTDHEILNSKSKTYSPRLAAGQYQVIFEIEELSCHDSHLESNGVRASFGSNPFYNQSNSSLDIEKIYLGRDESAAWGDLLRVKIFAYKGNESKSSIQAWIEIDGAQQGMRSRFSLPHKFSQTAVTIPLQIPKRCKVVGQEDIATLIVEGLGDRDEQEFVIRAKQDPSCKAQELENNRSKPEKASLLYVSNASAGSKLTAIVSIPGTKNDENYSVWAYAYRGPRCYSCKNQSEARNASMKAVTVHAEELKLLAFSPNLDFDLQEDLPYTLRVVLQKEGRKTADSLSSEFYVSDSNVKQEYKERAENIHHAENQLTGAIVSQGKNSSRVEGPIVYRSSSEKVKGSLWLVLLVMSCCLLAIILLPHKS